MIYRSTQVSGWRLALLFLILVVAFALRCWGAFSDLPYILHSDEPPNLQIIQEMLSSHSADPHRFLYPSLFYYVNVLAAIVFKVLPAVATGASLEFLQPLSIAMGSTYAPDSDAVELYRLVSICGGVLSVYLMFRIGARLKDTRLGLLAAALAAVSPIMVADCRHVTPDSYVILFELLTLLASLSIVRGGSKFAYIAAGVAIGATAASKYNGAIVCIFPTLAHLARVGWKPRDAAPLMITAIVSLLTFVALCPYIAIDYRQFVEDLSYQAHAYSNDHPGMDGNAPIWYATEIARTTGLACVLAICQLFVAWKQRSTATFFLAAFAIAYFVFISTFRICNDRTLLPVIPCILLMAAMFFEYLIGPEAPFRRIGRSLRIALPTVCLIALIAFPLLTTAVETIRLTKIDSRTTAREWINTYLSAHSVVAVESYSPYVDPDRFKVIRSERASEHSPDWYVSQGINYLVLSEGMFGRYLSPPYEHIADTAQYLELMKRFELVKKFTDGGYTVLVYKVR
jgi:4-amino-4-deoxy-L-arabinose transferase-like glycosyltransferase